MITALILSILLSTLAWLIYKFNERNANYWPKLGVKMANTGSLVTNLLTKDFTFVKQEMLIYNQLKDSKIGGLMELWNPVLYVVDLDVAKNIYIKDFDNFVNRRTFDVEQNDPHMHLTLFNQEDQSWKNLRSKMTPTFTTGKIKRMCAIFDSSSKKLVQALQTEVKNGATGKDLEVGPYIQKLTMDVIASVAFGISTNVFEDPDGEFIQMGKKISTQFAGLNLFKFFIIALCPALGRVLKLKFTDDNADKFVSNIIVQSLNRRAKGIEKRDDFLQLMLEARNGQLKKDDDDHLVDGPISNNLSNEIKNVDFTDDLIIAQCLGFLLGGFETEAAFLVWAVYELALNQEVQEQLHQLLKQGHEENGDQFSYEFINTLDYLDRVVSETLRKYPPVARTERTSSSDYKIPGTDFILPKGGIVALPIYPVHHDPKYWPEPDRFDPDRFTKENVASRHPCAYLPFGLGQRMCIANRFALMEGKVTLAHLVLNFKFEPSSKTQIPPIFSNSSTLKPNDNMRLKVTSRH